MDFSALFKLRQVVLYGFIGLSAVVVDYAGFLVLMHQFQWNPTLATGISVFVATVYAFILNAHFNFQKTDYLLWRSLSYFSVSGIGLLISMATLHVLSGRLGFDPTLVKAISIPFIVAVQYVLNVLISFSQTLFHDQLKVSRQ